MQKRRFLRLSPPPGLAYELDQLAKTEGRSLANLCYRLLGEAIDNRRLAHKHSSSDDIKRLIAMIAEADKGTVPADAA
jgi:hypothetical protein